MEMERRDCDEKAWVSPLEFCAGEADEGSGGRVVVPEAVDAIDGEDELLVIRRRGDQTRIYQGKVKELSPEVALGLLEKAISLLPYTDPADGRSLWLNGNMLCVASGDARRFGTMNPTALMQSLQEMLALLPTEDRGDGTPWLNGGTLMRGTLKRELF